MKITAVIGSPRKGNSYKVTKQIEQKLKECGDVEFEYIFLKDSHLETCRGCFACIQRGEEHCPLKDDRAKIEAQLLASDGVVFASPNYCNGVTSIMKNFIDRMGYIGHRPRFFRQSALVVATSAGPVGLKQTLFDLSYFAGGGFHIVKKLGLMTPPFPVSPKGILKSERKTAEAAKLLFNTIKNGKRSAPRFIDIIQFYAFKSMYRNFPEFGKKYFPADSRYWTERGWLDKNRHYFTDTKVSTPKIVLGKLFERIYVRAAPKILMMNKRS